MRPLLGCSHVFFLVFPALVAAAETVSKETVADRFDSVSLSGSNGSVDRSGPWVEEGEGDGPGGGQVSVGDGECAAGKCLRMSGGLLSGVGINRAADLGRFLDASLHYFLQGEPIEPRPPDGLRVTWVGVVADHPSGLMGQLGDEGTEVLAAEVGADFSLAVKIFEKARIWISILALVVAAAVIHGVDRRRSPKPRALIGRDSRDARDSAPAPTGKV